MQFVPPRHERDGQEAPCKEEDDPRISKLDTGTRPLVRGILTSPQEPGLQVVTRQTTNSPSLTWLPPTSNGLSILVDPHLLIPCRSGFLGAMRGEHKSHGQAHQLVHPTGVRVPLLLASHMALFDRKRGLSPVSEVRMRTRAVTLPPRPPSSFDQPLHVVPFYYSDRPAGRNPLAGKRVIQGGVPENPNAMCPRM
ncbi:hypothetical protein GMRT_15927 [Giardia muris]|uniref:Uncharacterized protein n=1 Tax=Giardia muris TaxID=5742 RepID=A0A4Z1SKL4_GIAMU|nr:hypothetical protein GMRT_15927 [Giardia muris]|eukprot:TNJ26194.1 hypothetical protein GMRT_15927 [Giardia muris]